MLLNSVSTIHLIPTNDNSSSAWTIQICDDAAAPLCQTIAINLDIQPVNDPPVIDALTIDVNEKTTSQICLTATDLESDTHEFTVGTSQTASATVDAGAGGDLCFDYTPPSGFLGVDIVEVTICDVADGSVCDTRTINVNVLDINEPPVFIENSLETTNITMNGSEDTPIDICIDVNDPEGDGVTTSSLASISGGGALTESTPLCYQFVPDANVNGSVIWEVEVCDDNASPLCNTVQIEIILAPVNDPPVIDALTIDVDEKTTSQICVTATDIENDSHEVTIGTSLSASATIATGSDGDLCFDYTPHSGFLGMDQVEVTICDVTDGTICDTQTINVNVLDVNEPPVFLDNSLETTNITVNGTEDTPIDICLDVNDPEGDGVTTSSIASISGGGALTESTPLCYQFVPDANVNGSVIWEVEVCDDNASPLCNTVQVEIILAPVNDPPVIDALTIDVDEKTTSQICVTATDIENDSHEVTIGTSLSASATIATGSEGNLCFDYTPPSGFLGMDQVEVTICDVTDGTICDTQTINVNVVDVNEPPIFLDNSLETNNITVDGVEDTPLEICLDVTDPEGDVISTSSIANLSGGGTLTENSSLCYQFVPEANVTGTVTWEIEVCDDNLNPLCNTVQVNINLANVNDAPIINSTVIDVSEKTTSQVCVSLTDIENDPHTFVSGSSLDANASISDGTTGDICFNYTPPDGFLGLDQVEVTICDSNDSGVCTTGIIHINVIDVNEAPIILVNGTPATDLIVNGLEDATTNFCFEVIDPEGDNVTSFAIDNIIGGGLLSEDATSFCYSLNPEADFNGLTRWEITVCDDQIPPLCSSILIDIDLENVNDSPQSVDGTLVIRVGDEPFTVYQTISPNGDGINDYWHIEGIDFYPNNSVRLYDRYNNLVFEMNGYDNDLNKWIGRSNTAGNKLLPEGTYYYRITAGEAGTFGGFVVLRGTSN